MKTLTTRVLNSSNSLAVQICGVPAGHRLGEHSRAESGHLVIHPLQAQRGAALFDALRAVGEADLVFIEALEAERAQQQPVE